LILALLYMGYVLVRVWLKPEMAPIPSDQDQPETPAPNFFKALLFPILSVVVVLGSIYGGVASVTEASALGVLGIAISTWIRGELSLAMVRKATISTLRVCGMIIWIGIGATALVGV
ncbi:TRAP transporter large permease subunit, partial [Marinobacter sp. UBA2678]